MTEWSHSILLTAYEAYSIGNPNVNSPVPTDCQLRRVPHRKDENSSLVEWQPGDEYGSWYCSRVDSNEWDALKFAVNIDETETNIFELDPSNGSLIDFVSHFRSRRSGNAQKCQSNCIDEKIGKFVKAAARLKLDLSSVEKYFEPSLWIKIAQLAKLESGGINRSPSKPLLTNEQSLLSPSPSLPWTPSKFYFFDDVSPCDPTDSLHNNWQHSDYELSQESGDYRSKTATPSSFIFDPMTTSVR